ncbi:hypothetical protein VNI00_004871 [Paramarasmius palmivorus]|uniref:F-box domain-containing protein n=1 Tax=Paramarasmius palmivorus TaxID=297713 RepID=A0AAW0DI28_9AGAR
MPRSSKKPRTDLEPPAQIDTSNSQHAPQAQLPLEVILIITDEFDPEVCEEKETLLSTALVSKAWCQAAQSKLFTTIRVNSSDTCKFWSRKLKKSPHLGTYVKELHLSDPNDDCMSSPYLRTQPAKTLASMCCRVRRIELFRFRRWGQVEQRVIKGFQLLEELRVEGVPGMSRDKDLPDLVYNLPNLLELTVGDIGEEYDYMNLDSIHEDGLALREKLPEDGKRIQLRHAVFLCADMSIDMFLWLNGPAFDHSRLEHVTLWWEDIPHLEYMPQKPDFASLSDFLRAVGPQLQTFYLGMPSPSGADGEYENFAISNEFDILYEYLLSSRILSNLQNLRTLAFCVGAEGCEDSVLALAICNTVALLRTMTTPRLETLEIEATLETSGGCELEEIFRVPQWEALDQLVSSSERFPILKNVMVEVNYKEYRYRRCQYHVVDEGHVYAGIKASLKHAYEKGLLEINML